jgi:hypothetical protein
MARHLAIIPVVMFIAVFIAAGSVLLGTIPAVVFGVASIGGFVLWLASTYRTPVDRGKVIIPYLFAVILFIVHVYEEYLTDFEVAMTDITGFHVLEKTF